MLNHPTRPWLCITLCVITVTQVPRAAPRAPLGGPRLIAQRALPVSQHDKTSSPIAGTAQGGEIIVPKGGARGRMSRLWPPLLLLSLYLHSCHGCAIAGADIGYCEAEIAKDPS
jgi:hypothetical protein